MNSCREYVPFFSLYILALSFLAHVATLVVAEETVLVKKKNLLKIHVQSSGG
jgi:hypothetical protein